MPFDFSFTVKALVPVSEIFVHLTFFSYGPGTYIPAYRASFPCEIAINLSMGTGMIRMRSQFTILDY